MITDRIRVDFNRETNIRIISEDFKGDEAEVVFREGTASVIGRRPIISNQNLRTKIALGYRHEINPKINLGEMANNITSLDPIINRKGIILMNKLTKNPNNPMIEVSKIFLGNRASKHKSIKKPTNRKPILGDPIDSHNRIKLTNFKMNNKI